MAIFGTKKNKTKQQEKKANKETRVSSVATTPGAVFGGESNNASGILLHPRITEKASMLAEKNAYVFEIHQNANKQSVAKAVKAVYNVTPVRVNIIQLPRKRVFSRGRAGIKTAVKKAVVYLKHGDKIEFV